MTRFDIGIDGYNLALPNGTGVATYGHVLTEVTSGVGPGASSSVELFGQFVSRSVDGVIKGTLVDDVWKAIT